MPKLVKSHPETKIQNSIRTFLEDRGWHVERLIGGGTIGGGVQTGLPDLFACHKKYGIRFIEIKYEDSYRFTKAQRWKFPLLISNGCGIWVLTDANNENYDRLFKPPNLWDYLDKSKILSEEVIDNILNES